MSETALETERDYVVTITSTDRGVPLEPWAIREVLLEAAPFFASNNLVDVVNVEVAAVSVGGGGEAK